MAREFRVTSRLWKQFPLAPKGILLCEDTEVLGAPFLIMQYRPGAVIHMELPEHLHDMTPSLSKMIIEVLVNSNLLTRHASDSTILDRPKVF